MSKMHYPEFELIESLRRSAKEFGRIERLATVSVRNEKFPIYGFIFGSDNKSLPTFGLFGGVHGLENIGTHVCVSFINNFISQLQWDKELRHRMSQMRLVSIPLINPGGMYLQQRSNPSGIDLMRNAPHDSLEAPHFLVGGHRFGQWLPWFRGTKGSPLELESETLINFVKQELFSAQASMSLDVHSGFGLKDRLWYPYAKTRQDFPAIREAKLIQATFEQSFPQHVYVIESQSKSYLTHGDLWDYLYDSYCDEHPSHQNAYIPWALEMGSWSWVRKNPLQMFSLRGPFNPIKPHRYRRILRRHLHLIDYLLRATKNYDFWLKKV